MLSKEEEEILEFYIKNDCCECDAKKEMRFCPDCYVDEQDMRTISKILKKYRILEAREQKLIEILEEELTLDNLTVKANKIEKILHGDKINFIKEQAIKATNAYRKQILEILKGEYDER